MFIDRVFFFGSFQASGVTLNLTPNGDGKNASHIKALKGRHVFQMLSKTWENFMPPLSGLDA